jgi:hypothetical protein
MAATPVLYNVPEVGRARIATANSNRDGFGTLDTVLTATADMRIERVTIEATGTTTAGMVGCSPQTAGGSCGGATVIRACTH